MTSQQPDEKSLREKYESDPKRFFSWIASVLATDDDEPTPEPEPPSTGKTYALCIGLNSVHPSRYGGWKGELASCENDARAVANALIDRGFTPHLALGEKATRYSVRHQIIDLTTYAKPGDTVVIYYSGHGGQFRELNLGGVGSTAPDEEDGLDETWCLYDGQLLDDELGQLLSKFHPDVRVIVVSDSCHSGTITKSHPSEANKFMPPEINEGPRIRAAISMVKKSIPLKTPNPPTVLLLAACLDNEVAYAGKTLSEFTSAFLASLAINDRDASVVHANVARHISQKQTPVIRADGPKWRDALRWGFRL